MSNKLLNRSFLTRTITGIVFVVVVAGSILLSQWTFLALLAVIGAGCLWEFYRIATMAGADPQKNYGMAVGVAMFATAFFVTIGYIPPVCLAMFIPFTAIVFIAELYRKKDNPLVNSAATLGGILYIALPLSVLSYIAISHGTDHVSYRPWVVLSYFAIAWANDTGAYIVGVSIGRHRLMERISPKKSWEGFFGGVIIAGGVGFLAGHLMDYTPAGCILWAGFGLVIAVSGVLGDLVESMFKRAVDLKDSGSIMPGHGGFLDRFDALLLSLPFAIIYFLVFEL